MNLEILFIFETKRSITEGYLSEGRRHAPTLNRVYNTGTDKHRYLQHSLSSTLFALPLVFTHHLQCS